MKRASWASKDTEAEAHVSLMTMRRSMYSFILSPTNSSHCLLTCFCSPSRRRTRQRIPLFSSLFRSLSPSLTRLKKSNNENFLTPCPSLSYYSLDRLIISISIHKDKDNRGKSGGEGSIQSRSLSGKWQIAAWYLLQLRHGVLIFYSRFEIY